MKKILQYGKLAVPALMIILMVMLGYNLVLSTTPTVTMTASTETGRDVAVYNFSFTTGISVTDTAVIYKTGTTPWYIGYVGNGAANPDSIITLHLETNEATVDSVRKKVLFQYSYEDSPNVTQLQHDNWYTVKSVTMDSSASDIYRFVPRRYGTPYKFRIMIIETNTSKDATQTFSGELAFPKYSTL